MYDPVGLKKCITYSKTGFLPLASLAACMTCSMVVVPAIIPGRHICQHNPHPHQQKARGGVLCVRTFVEPVGDVLCDGDGHELWLLRQEHHAARQLLSQSHSQVHAFAHTSQQGSYSVLHTANVITEQHRVCVYNWRIFYTSLYVIYYFYLYFVCGCTVCVSARTSRPSSSTAPWSGS